MDLSSWVGGIAASVAAATLLLAIAALPLHRPKGSPWLVILFEINAGYRVSREALRAVRPIDVLLLLLAGATFAGFWPGPGASHIAWMTLAIAQTLLGIGLLLATRLTGRSGLMGGALVLSRDRNNGAGLSPPLNQQAPHGAPAE